VITDEAQAVKTDGKAPEIVLSWTVSLAGRENLVKTLAALAAMTGVLALGAYLYGNVLLVTIGALIFFLATAEYFFPMRFWLTEEAAFRRTVFGTKFIRWSNIRHCYLDEKGIKLSPLKGPSRMEAFRGLFLYFGKNRDELVEAVRNLAPRDRG
jgi:hypothetical protein